MVFGIYKGLVLVISSRIELITPVVTYVFVFIECVGKRNVVLGDG